MADFTLTNTGIKPTANTQIAYGTSAEAIIAGQPVYADSTTSYKLRVAQGNSTQAKAEVVGIALNSAPAADQPVTYATGGDITVATGQVVQANSYVLGGGAGTLSTAKELEDSTTNTRYGTQIGMASTDTNLKLAIAITGLKNL